MTQEKKRKSNQLEGEGSYTGTRQYNRHLADHQKKKNIKRLADQAREAVDGKEGKELRRAERRGKEGPMSERPASRH